MTVPMMMPTCPLPSLSASPTLSGKGRAYRAVPVDCSDALRLCVTEPSALTVSTVPKTSLKRERPRAVAHQLQGPESALPQSLLGLLPCSPVVDTEPDEIQDVRAGRDEHEVGRAYMSAPSEAKQVDMSTPRVTPS